MKEFIIIAVSFALLVMIVDYYYVKLGDKFRKDLFTYRVVKKGKIFSEIELLRNDSEESTGQKSKISNVRLSMTYVKVEENKEKK